MKVLERLLKQQNTKGYLTVHLTTCLLNLNYFYKELLVFECFRSYTRGPQPFVNCGQIFKKKSLEGLSCLKTVAVNSKKKYLIKQKYIKISSIQGCLSFLQKFFKFSKFLPGF